MKKNNILKKLRSISFSTFFLRLYTRIVLILDTFTRIYWQNKKNPNTKLCIVSIASSVRRLSHVDFSYLSLSIYYIPLAVRKQIFDALRRDRTVICY